MFGGRDEKAVWHVFLHTKVIVFIWQLAIYPPSWHIPVYGLQVPTIPTGHLLTSNCALVKAVGWMHAMGFMLGIVCKVADQF